MLKSIVFLAAWAISASLLGSAPAGALGYNPSANEVQLADLGGVDTETAADSQSSGLNRNLR